MAQFVIACADSLHKGCLLIFTLKFKSSDENLISQHRENGDTLIIRFH